MLNFGTYRFRLKTATKAETDGINVQPNFSVFKHFFVVTLKPLIANNKIANLMLKL